MRYVYADIMIVCSIIAFFYATRVFYNKNYKKITYRFFSIIAISSGVWSLGYGMMFLQDDPAKFAPYRALGIAGIIMFMIWGQIVLLTLGGTFRKLWVLIAAEAVVGLGVFFTIIQPKNFTMTNTPSGIITAFTSAHVSLVYTLYTVFIAAVFVGISVDMTKKKNSKRIRAFGKAFLKVEGVIGLGMIVDTVLPAFGINPNIPASTMFQFLGLEIVYYATHKMNRNLISMENMTGYIYQSLKVPVLVFDTDHEIRLINDEAKALFGIGDESDSMRQDFWKRIFGLTHPEHVELLESTLILDSVYKEKDIHCRLSLDAIFDEYQDWIGYIVVVTDMTEQIRNMETIERARNEAEIANQAKSMFLANMSHEIRTPMNSILGFSTLALMENVDDISKEYFTDIKQSAEVLLSTINDILDISKIESGKMELVEAPYQTAEVFNEVATIIQMQASKKNLEFMMEIDPEYPSVLYGDKGRIREILINLLNNGIKYTKEGSVQLRGKILSKNSRTAKLRLEVSDTGMGMRPEDLEHIFESFKRVDLKANTKTEGTGLGLSITKGFVELMGGEIFVESTYGKGSTFVVELCQPIEDATPIVLKMEKREVSKKENGISLTNVSMLAVDDNVINLKVISNVLKHYGGSCDIAKDGPTAIELCKENQYQLVFMDQMMPEMDGVEAMQYIRKLGNGYEKGGKNKILALTANAIQGVREEMLSLGFDEYLSKPIEMGELERVIGELLEDSSGRFVKEEAEAEQKELQGLVLEDNSSGFEKKEVAQEKKGLQDMFPMLDVKKGMTYCMEEEDTYRTILYMVVDSGNEDLDELLSLYHQNKMKDFTIQIHGLKSLCQNIGALSMSERAKELEQAAKEKEFEIIKEKLGGFVADFRRLIQQIQDGLEGDRRA